MRWRVAVRILFWFALSCVVCVVLSLAGSELLVAGQWYFAIPVILCSVLGCGGSLFLAVLAPEAEDRRVRRAARRRLRQEGHE